MYPEEYCRHLCGMTINRLYQMLDERFDKTKTIDCLMKRREKLEVEHRFESVFGCTVYYDHGRFCFKASPDHNSILMDHFPMSYWFCLREIKGIVNIVKYDKVLKFIDAGFDAYVPPDQIRYGPETIFNFVRDITGAYR